MKPRLSLLKLPVFSGAEVRASATASSVAASGSVGEVKTFSASEGILKQAKIEEIEIAAPSFKGSASIKRSECVSSGRVCSKRAAPTEPMS